MRQKVKIVRTWELKKGEFTSGWRVNHFSWEDTDYDKGLKNMEFQQKMSLEGGTK